MGRILRILFLAMLVLVRLKVAFGNGQVVTLKLLPDDMETFLGLGLVAELPLFLIIFVGILVGLLIGFVWEWFREAKHRSEASSRRREVTQLSREVNRLREKDVVPKDDVLALLEGPGRAR